MDLEEGSDHAGDFTQEKFVHWNKIKAGFDPRSIEIVEGLLRCDRQAYKELIITASGEIIERRFLQAPEEEQKEEEVHFLHTSEAEEKAEEANLRNRKHPSTQILKVLIKRQRFKKLKITSPSKNLRRISYTCDGSTPGVLFEEWRKQTVAALPVSTAKKEEKLKKTLNLLLPYEQSFLFNVNGFRDDLHSILNVLSFQPISWMVLDAYLSSRVNFHSLGSEAAETSARNSRYSLRQGFKNFKYLPCQFLPILEKITCKSQLKPMRKDLIPEGSLGNTVLIAPQVISQQNIMKKVATSHYYLAVFDFRVKEIRIYDSSRNYVPTQLRELQVRKVLKYLLKKVKQEDGQGLIGNNWEVEVQKECPQQIDKVSCGCYVVHHAEQEMGRRNFNQMEKLKKEDLKEIRMKIVKELLPTTGYGRKVLEALSD